MIALRSRAAGTLAADEPPCPAPALCPSRIRSARRLRPRPDPGRGPGPGSGRSLSRRGALRRPDRSAGVPAPRGSGRARLEGGRTLAGPEALAAEIRDLRRAFPDWNERVEAVLVEGDRVATRVVATGTHRGSFRGIEPTGRRIEIRRLSQFRLRDGRVAAQWSLTDLAALERQLVD
ncbi:MAG: ester cyclase [Gammaproteobacteria bacterium]|nr:ester cyclase [Gammaproteobacteria bacterium]